MLRFNKMPTVEEFAQSMPITFEDARLIVEMCNSSDKAFGLSILNVASELLVMGCTASEIIDNLPRCILGDPEYKRQNV